MSFDVELRKCIIQVLIVTTQKILQPRFVLRKRDHKVYDWMIDNHKRSYLTSIIASGRMIGASEKAVDDMLNPSIDASRYEHLKDVHKAADRIISAILNHEVIGLVTDFDVDGITSAVVMYRALTEAMGVEKSNVRLFINKRMEYSYGFNDGILKEILSLSDEQIPTLLITADQGSNDSPRIQSYKSALSSRGFPYAGVIVTDHHNIQNPTCDGADAFVNPQRPDCMFGDKTICGCVVALIVMRVTLDLMMKRSLLPEPVPRLGFLMGYAGLATVADCVSLSTPINRRIVKSAIHEMQTSNLPAWRIFRESRPTIDSTSLGFLLGPCINADSRTGGDGTTSFKFLTSTDYDEALEMYQKLTYRNEDRKEIGEVMLRDAIEQASIQYKNGRRGLVVFLKNGHHGVQGIVASRIKDYFDCPVIIFSPQEHGVVLGSVIPPSMMLSGSGRSPSGFHIEAAVRNYVAPKTTIEKFGGHKGAMGARIQYQYLDEFSQLFDEVVKSEGLANKFDFYPTLLVDHVFQDESLGWLSSSNAVDLILPQIDALEPYGQQFESPLFAISGRVVAKRFISNGVHGNVTFQDSIGATHRAVAFNVELSPWFSELMIGSNWTFVIKIGRGSGNYQHTLSMSIVSARPGLDPIDF